MILPQWINEDIRLADHVPIIPPHSMEWCVSDIVTDHGYWNMDFLNEFVPMEIIHKLLAHPVPLPHDGPDDRY